jgi:uncharacterized membrane protein YgdD (TMEM256/DUF423 family)
MERVFAAAGAVSALIAVAAGAFGAHGLRRSLPPDLLATFETAARYQMYHALALLVTAWAWAQWRSAAIRVAGWLFLAGTILFSGSLYLLALTDSRWLGAVTPLGGITLIAGWGALAAGAWKRAS